MMMRIVPRDIALSLSSLTLGQHNAGLCGKFRFSPAKQQYTYSAGFGCAGRDGSSSASASLRRPHRKSRANQDGCPFSGRFSRVNSINADGVTISVSTVAKLSP